MRNLNVGPGHPILFNAFITRIIITAIRINFEFARCHEILFHHEQYFV